MADETKIARLAEIQQQIKTLTLEGIQIADEEQVVFELGDAPFAANYGSGGLEYYPKGEGPYLDGDWEMTDMSGESVRGQWMSSNSWGC